MKIYNTISFAFVGMHLFSRNRDLNTPFLSVSRLFSFVGTDCIFVSV